MMMMVETQRPRCQGVPLGSPGATSEFRSDISRVDLGKYTFWEVDLKEKFSADLDQFPLGRKFLLQAGLKAKPKLKRAAPTSTRTSSAKRKKVKK